MKGISLQKAYLSLIMIIVLNHPEIKHSKNKFHDLATCSGQCQSESLFEGENCCSIYVYSAEETKYFVFSKPRHNIFCGVFYEKNGAKRNMYPIKIFNSTIQRPAQAKLRIGTEVVVDSKWIGLNSKEVATHKYIFFRDNKLVQ